MKITKISVKNFRSIEILEDLEIGAFNVFVGQNNHGKTNLFEAVEWFFIGSGSLDDIRFMRDPNKEVSVEIEFSGLQNALNLISNDKQKKALSDIFGDVDSISIRRSSVHKDGNDRQLWNPKTGKWENPMGRDSTWRQFLPILEYVSTKKFLEDVAKYGKTTPISRMLSAVLEKMLEKDPVYDEFKQKFNELFGDPADPEQRTQIRESIDEIGNRVAVFLQKQFPDCAEVKFKVENPEIEDLFKKFRTTVNDGIENDASEKGDGMQRALMLAIIQAYQNFQRDDGESNNFLFLIDEAELHLHPTAQRALKDALLEISNGLDQVFINTHSSVLVVDEHANQKIFKVEKIDHRSNIDEVSEFGRQDVVFDLLGGSPKDLLLPNNFLIVEGESEFEFLREVVRIHYSSEKKVKILNAHGDVDQASRTIGAIEKIFTPINESIYQKQVIILLDELSEQKISEGAYSEFLRKFPDVDEDEQIFKLPVGSLEEYYPVAKQNQAGGHNDVPKWKRTKTEADSMDSQQKVKLARAVSAKIEKEQFENDMSVVFEALKKCWEKAY